VVANSGLLDQRGPVSQVKPQDLRDHFEINTIAPIVLFQATLPLLEASENSRFFLTSSNIASFELMPHIPMPTIAYGMSKSAANYAVARIHHENPKISSVALHPGWVQTRIGQKAVDLASVTEIPVTVEDSAAGLLKQVRSVFFVIF
jgi:norsolorinic acid ketoreductase